MGQGVGSARRGADVLRAGHAQWTCSAWEVMLCGGTHGALGTKLSSKCLK